MSEFIFLLDMKVEADKVVIALLSRLSSYLTRLRSYLILYAPKVSTSSTSPFHWLLSSTNTLTRWPSVLLAGNTTCVFFSRSTSNLKGFSWLKIDVLILQIVYCCWLVAETAFRYTFIIETKNRTLEETAALFDGVNAPDLVGSPTVKHKASSEKDSEHKSEHEEAIHLEKFP